MTVPSQESERSCHFVTGYFLFSGSLSMAVVGGNMFGELHTPCTLKEDLSLCRFRKRIDEL